MLSVGAAVGPRLSLVLPPFVTYINSVEQKIEMEMWALKDCGSHSSGARANHLSVLSGAQRLPSRSHSSPASAEGSSRRDG